MFSSGHGALGNLAKVLQVPGRSHKKIFSVKQACKNGYKISFHGNTCDIFNPDDIQQLSLAVLSAFLKPPSYQLYELRIYSSPEEEEFNIDSADKLLDSYLTC